MASMSSVDVLVARMQPGFVPRVEPRGRSPASPPCSRTRPRSPGRRCQRPRRPTCVLMRSRRVAHVVGRQPAARDRRLVVPGDGRKAPVDERLRRCRSGATVMPALAQAMAMPPPIVPAPTIATDVDGRRRVRGQARHLGHGALGEERVDERLGLFGPGALEEQLALAHGSPWSNGSVAAAAIASTATSGASRCVAPWRPARVRPRASRAGRSAAAACPYARACGAAARAGPLSRAPATRRPATRSPSTIQSMSPACSASSALMGRPETHISSAFSTPTRRGSRCVPFGAGNDAEVHLGLSQPGVAARHAVVAGHRQFQPAAERGAVHRHHHGLGAVLDAAEEVVHVGRPRHVAPGHALEPLDVGAGHERAARAHHHDGPRPRGRPRPWPPRRGGRR